MNTPIIQIVHQGRLIELTNIPHEKTLIELIRDNMHLFGTKEACASGDCGACAVVLGKQQGNTLVWQAVNSCIRLAHSVHGMALWTAQDLSAPAQALHPVQSALLKAHASQCGFCTPGFTMSFFELYQRKIAQEQAVTAADISHQLSGNLCRCTGYRPMLQAGTHLKHEPSYDVDEAPILHLLAQISPRTDEQDNCYVLPKTLAALMQIRHARPQAQLVAGCTDVGLWLNKQHQHFQQIIDLTQVDELQHIVQRENRLEIGAGVNLEDAFEALSQEWPEVREYARRFAGLLVRRSGTLGGNIANGSPIGDGSPLLIALRASIVLSRWQDDRLMQREIKLEDFYQSFRVKDLKADEVLTQINVPRVNAGVWVRAYKISKRQEDDISAVAMSIRKITDTQGNLLDISIGAGGVAATPKRARETEQALLTHGWNEQGIEAAKAAIEQEFSPLTDLRASKAYRRDMLKNLLQRAWLESNTSTTVTLEQVL